PREQRALFDLLACLLRRRFERAIRRRRRQLLRIRQQLVDRALRRDTDTNQVFHILELRIAAFLQRVQTRDVIAVVVVEHLARFTYLGAAERPSARTGNALTGRNGCLILERDRAEDR